MFTLLSPLIILVLALVIGFVVFVVIKTAAKGLSDESRAAEEAFRRSQQASGAFCPRCGNSVTDQNTICPSCGLNPNGQ